MVAVESTAIRILLDPTEIAYLVRLVGGESVIGFPDAELMSHDHNLGEQSLKQRGWLQEEVDGWNLADDLYLMASVLALPDRVVKVRVTGDDPRVTTFYEAGGHILEVFQTANSYAVGLSLDIDHILNRCLEALVGVEQAPSPARALRIPMKVLAPVLSLADASRPSELQRVLSLAGADEETSQRWSDTIVPGKAHLAIEVVGFLTGRALSQKDIYAFGSPAVLVAGDSQPQNQAILSAFDRQRLGDMLKLCWDSVTPIGVPSEET